MLCGMRWSCCLVYLDDVISFGTTAPEALQRLEEVLECLSAFGLQLKAKKCTFMQTEVAFLGHTVGRAGLACDPEKVLVLRAWHAPGSVKQVRQFVGFNGYYRRFIQHFAGLSEPLVALTWKGVIFAWTPEQQVVFDTLKASLLHMPILGFPTEEGRFILDTDASLFALGGVLSQLQDGQEVVIAYASWTVIPALVLHYTMGNAGGGFYLRGAQFTPRTDHRSLRWLQNFRNSDGILARW